jgi:hypothetical protein
VTTLRAVKQPVTLDPGAGAYSTQVTRRWRTNNPRRARWLARRSNTVRTRAASWVRVNRSDVWAQLWADVEAEMPEPQEPAT